MKKIKGGVTAAQGFMAAGAEAGIKYHNRKDMAMVYSSVPARAAGTFTSNVVKAAPVLWDRERIDEEPYLQAIVVNSGIANAATGRQGLACCQETAEAAGAALGIPAAAVLLGSTGVIGPQLKMDRIRAGIGLLKDALSDTLEAGTAAAEAIMTTDTHSKQAAVEFELDGRKVTIGGMAKGSGMIHPNMCTMLAYVTTDALISRELLAEALREDVKDSFNMISVDGDTSTNDTLIVMANGLAGNSEICRKDEAYSLFRAALNEVTTDLARQMAGDGEGATALLEAKVVGAISKQEARTLAKSVVCSSLCKAAIYGHDANWGRFLCALGYSGVSFDPERVELSFHSEAGSVVVYREGSGTDYDEEEATGILSCPEVTFIADMKQGEASATAWGCDLSLEYVKINADYRS